MSSRPDIVWVMCDQLRWDDRNDPLFLLVGIKDPHPPIIPPPELLDLYDGDRLPFPGNFHDPLEGKPRSQTQRRGRVPPGSVTVDEFRTVIRYYYALVTHVDRQIGRLVAALERAGRLDRTIFVVNSAPDFHTAGVPGYNLFPPIPFSRSWRIVWTHNYLTTKGLQLLPTSAAASAPIAC